MPTLSCIQKQHIAVGHDENKFDDRLFFCSTPPDRPHADIELALLPGDKAKTMYAMVQWNLFTEMLEGKDGAANSNTFKLACKSELKQNVQDFLLHVQYSEVCRLDLIVSAHYNERIYNIDTADRYKEEYAQGSLQLSFFTNGKRINLFHKRLQDILRAILYSAAGALGVFEMDFDMSVVRPREKKTVTYTAKFDASKKVNKWFPHAQILGNTQTVVNDKGMCLETHRPPRVVERCSLGLPLPISCDCNVLLYCLTDSIVDESAVSRSLRLCV